MSEPAPGSARRRAAVLGHPIAHSLSPVLHRAAYAALGLDWTYEAVDVSADGLEDFLGTVDDRWAGLSLTMPLKHTVLPLLDHVEPLAEVVGAVNTVLVQPGRRRTLIGANTDVYGIVAALAEAGVRSARRAVILGGGATAASSLAALAQLGCTTPRVLVRSTGRIGPLLRAAHRMGVDPRPGSLDADLPAELTAADVVISTLPAHAADPVAAALAGSRVLGAALDCAYEPRPTALTVAWTAAGGLAVSGERMLLHQAAEQVRLMTGRPAPVERMDAALAGVMSP